MGGQECPSENGTFELKVGKGGGNSVSGRGNSQHEGLRLGRLWLSWWPALRSVTSLWVMISAFGVGD